MPAVATSIGAFAGTFQWGPILSPVTVTSENVLVQRFGKPNDSTFASFFTAANFLSYSNNLVVVRVDSPNSKNAVSKAESSIKIRNLDHYLDQYVNGSADVGSFAAKFPGTLGNSLKVSMADSTSFASWEYKNEFDGNPGTTQYTASLGGSDDGLHIIVIDKDGLWTGTSGAILEKFAYVSKASDARKSDGTNNYYKNVINDNSKYVWWMDHPVVGTITSNWGSEALNTDFTALVDGATTVASFILAGGVDDFAPTDGNIIDGFRMFENSDLIDISLIMCGKASPVVVEDVIGNVAEVRRDCVVFASPQNVSTGEVIVGNGSDAVNALIAYRDELPSSSYAFLDSGFKYQYDKYNDKYRWVPLNGDIAGLCARTDYTNDAWWSPAGFNRGQIKNVVKLAVNPGRTERDNMFKSGINPVVNFPGEGVVLFGDKTLLATPSAFDAINVRRLFIVLEKAIATASNYSLYEFNDPFTRAQFKNMVEPFLRDVQGRRGVQDFRVKCDETNNTGEVLDRNEFIADIYIKPARAIRYIQLSFIAARSGVSFEEIGA